MSDGWPWKAFRNCSLSSDGEGTWAGIFNDDIVFSRSIDLWVECDVEKWKQMRDQSFIQGHADH
jgi:hypothetical protein